MSEEPSQEQPEEASDAPSSREPSNTFAARADSAREHGVLAESSYFLRRSRKWWMTPIIVMLLIVGTLLVMAWTAVGPLIYALF